MREWQGVLETLKKNKNPLYDLYKDASPEVTDKIIFYFQEEEAQQKAQKKWPKLQKHLPPHWQSKRIACVVGNAPSHTLPGLSNGKKPRGMQKTGSSPLQALNHEPLDDRITPALQKAIDAEKKCAALYKSLTEKTQLLATATVEVSFLWRLRVGGLRGFRELLLPALHPIYGVPYIPASSLKGVIRAYGRQNLPQGEVERLLGTLEGGIGRVQILDAFPTQPCLDLDITTPQWNWQDDRIVYQPAPHVMLSMLKPTLTIGLAPTARGTPEDVAVVREWVKPALTGGLGARVSSGYGCTTVKSALPHSCKHDFQLWTEGMYGATPPTRENGRRGKPEFRPTAIRGVLRYWFRVLGLSLYPLAQCREVEAQLFGTIAPQTRQGSCTIAVDWLEEVGSRTYPDFYEGEIVLASQNATHLRLLEYLLYLATHLGGVGHGSRRPLHWNHPYPGLRGCYWAVESLQLPCDQEDWRRFFEEIGERLRAVASPQGKPETHSPGKGRHRYQDVLDQQACVFLVPNRGLRHPEQVKDWSVEGCGVDVRGEALDWLYSSGFKGRNRQGGGNAYVGGDLEIPSFVVIKSNFPEGKIPYQAVTIFGAKQSDRAAFARSLSQVNGIRILSTFLG
ncbi:MULTISPECIES: RAMP superfamily CRISPR-associated protein [Limnospira]|uniref:Cmr6 family CRISPR-associated RAMP protein n=2 Tax=Limnospira platensis TaxID=118562 RepID=A0A5M3T8F6_LIMPL|nr:RAMP superfamily CRISPR-associated protein [Arthrospira platensis]AMW30294.1 CRISPR-associated protein Cmr6 [Arthrospira platensis YZ]KDR58284.1 CRISPR-associated protein Cmr6 [Arthrospira platensis str. Paraca]MBD2572780.1 CRISPR-associated protein Cmr6 [Arthrospira platensis FACHB-971]MBD2669276.1 CRISPR-associated protein Cmr6 [Arthrospira platensis FACHB-439]MBD2711607.1 CRISPR-associated protein Cmr6 [Arthrospira platensis FACHB-835]MDF2207784.1 RAMP superfamily CRISPR-associated prot